MRRSWIVAIATCAVCAGCSGGGGGSSDDLPATDVTFPGGFPITGTTDPSVVSWYRVQGLVTGSSYTAVVVATSTTADDAIFINVVSDKNDPFDTGLCPSQTDQTCTFAATSAVDYIAISNGFTPVGETPQPVEYTANMSQ